MGSDEGDGEGAGAEDGFVEVKGTVFIPLDDMFDFIDEASAHDAWDRYGVGNRGGESLMRKGSESAAMIKDHERPWARIAIFRIRCRRIFARKSLSEDHGDGDTRSVVIEGNDAFAPDFVAGKVLHHVEFPAELVRLKDSGLFDEDICLKRTRRSRPGVIPFYPNVPRVLGKGRFAELIGNRFLDDEEFPPTTSNEVCLTSENFWFHAFLCGRF